MCSVERCERTVFCRGMCQKHYTRWLRHGDVEAVNKNMGLRSHVGTTLLERMAAKLVAQPGPWLLPWFGCWEWQAVLQKGYGRSGENETGETLAHRIVYVLLRGPIPDGLTLDHACRNRRCCNPWHLEPVTAVVNAMRGDGFAAINARKTHCPQGHALAGANLTVERTTGRRRCAECAREAKRRYKQRQRAA